jgi:hypothetical protein
LSLNGIVEPPFAVCQTVPALALGRTAPDPFTNVFSTPIGA